MPEGQPRRRAEKESREGQPRRRAEKGSREGEHYLSCAQWLSSRLPWNICVNDHMYQHYQQKVASSRRSKPEPTHPSHSDSQGRRHISPPAWNIVALNRNEACLKHRHIACTVPDGDYSRVMFCKSVSTTFQYRALGNKGPLTSWRQKTRSWRDTNFGNAWQDQLKLWIFL